jgi:hypothetical protein
VRARTGTAGTAGRLARVALAGTVVLAGALTVTQAAAASGSHVPRWRAQFPPVPAGAIASDLGGVSCASSRSCAAVGNFEGSGSVFGTFAETWNGASWTIRSTPNAADSNLSAVSCTASKACTAVGDVLSGGVLVPLAERWNGTSWTVQRPPRPGGAAKSFLVSVSCADARACTAAGFWVSAGGGLRTLAEHWNGVRWALQPTPDPAGKTMSKLTGVSCSSATACRAVGTFTSGAFAEVWNGKTWKIRDTPLPGGGRDGFLGGISCLSARNCTAAGSYVRGAREVPLAEHWNGSRWEPRHAAVPAGASSSGLVSVSCVTAGSCFAVGFSITSTGAALAEHWNGRTWAVQGTQLPPGGQSADLSTVSCTSPVACAAAGFFTSASRTQTILAERYS